MGDFKKNPKAPFVVQVPNKIRTRIAMHEKHKPESIIPDIVSPLMKLLGQPAGEKVRKRGSLWSRFTRGVANFFNIKPEIRK